MAVAKRILMSSPNEHLIERRNIWNLIIRAESANTYNLHMLHEIKNGLV